MFLKSLEIHGFKSFADRTCINFANGITALLGPNGCGKSNVVDAIKWVLAENKSKNLRASSMEDVIFNGTESRAALSMAEVTLTIYNSFVNGRDGKRLLPMEEDEISIRRRLYRSGENEYYINGRQCTATEIRRLFMDTGVGKAAYSVMEQGKIDQILSSKPEDRRYLFEEAAGISRSKAEVAEAQRDLERTRANLAQIDIALAETKRNYETLKVQAEQAKKHRKLTDEKFDYELDIQLLRLKDFTQNKARQEQNRKEAEKSRDAVMKEIEEIYATLSENTDKVKNLQEMVNTKQTEAIRLSTAQSGKKDMCQQLKMQQSNLREKLGQIESRIKSIRERIEEYNDEIDNLNSDLHGKNKQLEDINKNINGFIENIKQASLQMEENSSQVAANRAKIQNLDSQYAELQKKLAAITEDIVTELDAKLKDAGYSSANNKKAKEELTTSLEKIKIYTSGRANIFKDFASLPSHSEKDASQFSSDAVNAFNELGKMLEELGDGIEKYSRTTPQFIDDFLSPEGIITKKRNIDDEINRNRQSVSQLNEDNNRIQNINLELSKKINEYKDTLGKLEITRAGMAQQITSCQQQISTYRKTLASEEAGLRDQEAELFQENKRREDLDEQLQDLEEEIAEIQHAGEKITQELAELDRQIADCNNKVSGKQNALKKKQDEKNKYQSQLEKYSVSIIQSETEIRNVKQNFQDNYSRDLMEFEERMYTITATPASLREKLAETKRRIDGMGQVNHMAVALFDEEKERYERQQVSYNDTKKTLEDLVRVSDEIRTKSSELFLDTYNKIRKNFHNMFRRLFGGGRAELKLADPTNVLASGIEIYAQPPGKKLEAISLLSGGEKTMTAVALLFATYQVRPSPFCLLDEIDAALDDKNVTSFVNALRAFANVSQYIVITHNRKTALGTNTMLGVTMQDSGITKVVQIKVDEDSINGRLEYDTGNDFEDEEIPPEEGIVIPPRPPRREHNPDGSLKEEPVSAENAGATENKEVPKDKPKAEVQPASTETVNAGSNSTENK